ncbi:hypothetical protein HN51_037540 [Arachis hypogaea]
MESEQKNKEMKEVVAVVAEPEMVVEQFHQGAINNNGLVRQTSMNNNNNNNCLCSPTTHAGSFRCRLHRSTLQRTKSIDR